MVVCRYKPEAKNYFKRGYSGFRNGITFGTKIKAQNFIQKLKKWQKKKDFELYEKFRIVKVCD